MEMIYTTLRKS